ncbi:hypothetical protein FRC12_017531 [Ceratobasidium sp. 428]|nr:hypothetical protein FRC12_017531 [Ceratobasidium sp. 428]
MHRFFIALALLLVTGYLAVADLLSSVVLQAVFFFSALSVICHLYVYTADFVQRIVTMHNCHERVNAETPQLKSHSGFYALAILQIGARWLGRSLKEAIYETCRASLPIIQLGLSATISRMPTPVGTTLNRLKPYHDWLPYSTPRLVVALICLGYLTFWALSLVLKHVVARLAGLALYLRSACTPTTTACLSIIVCLYVYSSHELRKTVANFIASINSMIPFKLSPLDCDVLYDREYDDIPDLELEDVSKNVNHPPASQPQAWQPLPHSTVIPTSPVRSQTPLSESDDGTTAGSRPLPRDDLAELAAQALRRMREAAQAELAAALAANKASNSAYLPLPCSIELRGSHLESERRCLSYSSLFPLVVEPNLRVQLVQSPLERYLAWSYFDA